jgi:hypothetical protein
VVRDLSHLPVARDDDASGPAPDAQPRFGPILAQRWFDDAVPLARAHPDARFRHSDAGNCARAIAYAAMDLPESNPMDLPGYWVVELGKLIHALWQEELVKQFPGAEVEVKVHEGRRAGHVDAVVKLPVARSEAEPYDGVRVIAIEGKSVGGYAYQLAVGAKGQPQGPKDKHVVQAALHGRATDADEVVVVYWGRDAISVQQAERKGFDQLTRFTAEWTFTREQYEPVADAEIARVEGILSLLDDGVLPARIIPGLPKGAMVVQPQKGAWVATRDGQAISSGTAWQCPYCRWQDTCSRTAPGRTPVEQLVEIGALP